MPRQDQPLLVPDLSRFARALGRGLQERHAERPTPPCHTEVLNLVARALGHRNYQALRAAAPGAPAAHPAAQAAASALPLPQAAPQAASAPTLSDNARKALAQFDAAGCLQRWPVKFSVQRLAMWVLWMRFEAKRLYTEREVNAVLRQANAFGDHATLRRELVNHKLLARKSDCSEYRKLAARPDEEARALMAAARARFRVAG